MLFDPKWEHLAPWQKVLLDASSLIEIKGHCKNSHIDKYGRVCILGAIGLSSGNHVSDWLMPGPGKEAVRMIARYIGHRRILEWNDAPERTQEEVIAVLRSAAVIQ